MSMIESKQNKQVKEWKKLHRKKYRDQSGLFLIEGWHLIHEVSKSEWIIDTLILNENETLPENLESYPVERVSEQVFKDLSQTESPQGVMAVVKQKNDFELSHLKKVLLIDAVQDPGNVGTMIRSALAFHVDLVVIGSGSVDLFNDKVIRSTQGALFHLPVVRGVLTDWIDDLKQQSIPVYGTALDRNAMPLREVQSSEYALVVGNEGQGVSEDILSVVDEKLYIPIHSKSESLNVGVATSIALYHLQDLT
ncbi:TrmH family RNA methyltransferase [Aquisalibacillus elongatus]|nr:RNA methyltransferase [Aquisalibacillus elongatus]